MGGLDQGSQWEPEPAVLGVGGEHMIEGHLFLKWGWGEEGSRVGSWL